MTLHDYWRILRRQKWAFLACFMGCVVGTGVFTYRLPSIYRTEAEVIIRGGNVAGPSLPSGMSDLLGMRSSSGSDPVEDAVNIMKGPIIMNLVIKRLGLLAEQATLDQLKGKVAIQRKTEYGNVVKVIVESVDLLEVAQIANAMAEEYLEWASVHASQNQLNIAKALREKFVETDAKLVQAEKQLREFQEAGYTAGLAAVLTSQKYSLETELEQLLGRYTSQHQRVQEANKRLKVIEERLTQASQQEIRWNRMQRELAMTSESWKSLKIETERSEAMATQKVVIGEVINPAVKPLSPYKPNKRLNMTVAVILGLLMGVVVSFVLENLDRSLGSVEEVEASIELPVLGVIPYTLVESKRFIGVELKNLFRRSPEPSARVLAEKLILNQGPRSRVAESFRALRANLSLLLNRDDRKVIVFTSSGPREGKTLTVANYALAASESGLKTLLIDADLRRPTLFQLFGLSRQPGLVEVARSHLPWQSVLRGTTDFLLTHTGVERVLEMPGIENLRILTSGGYIQNPLEIIGSPLIQQIFEEARQEFDLILVDCPPLLMFADPLIVSQKADGSIIVYEMGRTDRDALHRVKNQFQAANIPLLGVIINGMRGGEEYYYRTSAHYKYYGEEEKKLKRS